MDWMATETLRDTTPLDQFVYHYYNDDHGLETETLSDTTPLDYNNDTTNYNTTNTLWYYAIEVMLRD